MGVPRLKPSSLPLLEKATPAERSSYLDEACAGEEGLRRRVERLIANHSRCEKFLERPVVEAAVVGRHRTDRDGSGRTRTKGRRVACGSASIPGSVAAAGCTGVAGGLPSARGHRPRRNGNCAAGVRREAETSRRATSAWHRPWPRASRRGSYSSARRRATAAVTHDNVIAIYAVEDDTVVPYLVMPLIDGPNLQADD